MFFDVEIFFIIKIKLFMYHCLGIKDIDKNNRFNYLLVICFGFFPIFYFDAKRKTEAILYENFIIIKLLLTKTCTHTVTLWTFVVCKKSVTLVKCIRQIP